MTRVPCRIQRRREKGWRMPAGAIYVGRPTKFGNPCLGFSHDPRAQFREWVNACGQILWAAGMDLHREIMLANLPRLRGRDLACWCGLCPEHAAGLPLGVHCEHCSPCHADVLLEIANR